jgi:hypothetical protein
MSVVVAPSTRAGDAISLSVRSSDTFNLATYREMEKNDRRTLGLILTAMRETVFYAQESMGRSVICASPMPIAVTELIERVDREIATPSNPAIQKYADNDQLAFIFISAMKNADYCN